MHRRTRISLGLAWVIACVVAFAALALVDAPRWLALAAKEGALERSSHALLGVATLAWLARARQAPRRVPLVLAGFCLVVLAEELDWGAHLGWSTIAAGLRAGVGDTNLHNLLGGASYLIFAVPPMLFYGSALRGAGAHRPARADAVAFALIAATAAASLGAPPSWESSLDELSELMLYGLIACSGLVPPESQDA
ncbi:MAG: hypothetical protein AAGA54_20780 [Myxococcota bacterium]